MCSAGGAGSARDEWLTKVAVLGRAAAPTALPLLTNLINNRQQQISHTLRSGKFCTACMLAMTESC